jgi:hypothetical protein
MKDLERLLKLAEDLSRQGWIGNKTIDKNTLKFFVSNGILIKKKKYYIINNDEIDKIVKYINYKIIRYKDYKIYEINFIVVPLKPSITYKHFKDIDEVRNVDIEDLKDMKSVKANYVIRENELRIEVGKIRLLKVKIELLENIKGTCAKYDGLLISSPTLKVIINSNTYYNILTTYYWKDCLPIIYQNYKEKLFGKFTILKPNINSCYFIEHL